jgi:hypothetical protein
MGRGRENGTQRRRDAEGETQRRFFYNFLCVEFFASLPRRAGVPFSFLVGEARWQAGIDSVQCVAFVWRDGA